MEDLEGIVGLQAALLEQQSRVMDRQDREMEQLIGILRENWCWDAGR